MFRDLPAFLVWTAATARMDLPAFLEFRVHRDLEVFLVCLATKVERESPPWLVQEERDRRESRDCRAHLGL